MAEYSDYQRRVIRRFYENREQGDQQRLEELVTNLFLANEKKRRRLWEQARELLGRLKVPQQRIDHVLKTADPAILAEVVKELAAGTLRCQAPPTRPAPEQEKEWE